jgi:hypothetical protein
MVARPFHERDVPAVVSDPSPHISDGDDIVHVLAEPAAQCKAAGMIPAACSVYDSLSDFTGSADKPAGTRGDKRADTPGDTQADSTVETRPPAGRPAGK